MNFDELASSMTPDIYSRLREAVELGRWPNGLSLTKEQKSLCLEAIIKFEVTQNMPEESRTGYLSNQCKTHDEPETIPTVSINNKEISS